jgi:hypothetical protein
MTNHGYIRVFFSASQVGYFDHHIVVTQESRCLETGKPDNPVRLTIALVKP